MVGSVLLDKSDLDPEFDRLMEAGRDIDGLFNGTIGCDEIKETIKGYPKLARTAKEIGREAQDFVPMTFIFKGPPGNSSLQRSMVIKD